MHLDAIETLRKYFKEGIKDVHSHITTNLKLALTQAVKKLQAKQHELSPKTQAYINIKLDKIRLKVVKIYQPTKKIKINEGHEGRQGNECAYSNNGNESGSSSNRDSDCSSNGSSVSSNGGDSTFPKRDEDGYTKMDMNNVAQFGA